jgi:hypothetical protein
MQEKNNRVYVYVIQNQVICFCFSSHTSVPAKVTSTDESGTAASGTARSRAIEIERPNYRPPSHKQRFRFTLVPQTVDDTDHG